MKLLITGATGYIGRRVVEFVVRNHSQCDILTVNRNVIKAKELLPYKKCTHIHATDIDAIVKFRPEIVLHLATLSTSRCDSDIIEPIIDVNITYGAKLLDIISNIGSLELFINIGTFAEYRLGTSKQKSAYLYSATKSAFRHFVDFYADAYNFKYINIVPYTVYGGEDTAKKLIDYMVDSVNSKEPISMTKGEQILDFIHVDDVVDFVANILFNYQRIQIPLNGAEIHLGTGIGTRVKDLALMIEKTHNVKCNINWGALNYRPLDIMYAVAPSDDIKKHLDWRYKTTLEDGVKRLKIQ